MSYIHNREIDLFAVAATPSQNEMDLLERFPHELCFDPEVGHITLHPMDAGVKWIPRRLRKGPAA